MEPLVLQNYMDTYYVTLLELPNVSFIMQGVLLESFVKEIIYKNELKHYKGNFGASIKRCKDKGYLEENEIRFLERFKDNVRNIYQHSDIEKLTKGSSARVWEIPFNMNDILGSLVPKIEAIKSGKGGPPKIIKGDEIRPISVVIKQAIDEKYFFEQFLHVDYFIRKMSRKYFPIS